MKIEIDSCETWQYLCANPWIWIALLISASYMFTGIILNKMSKTASWNLDDKNAFRVAWFFSPIILPILLLSIPSWMLSFGFVRPFWEWKD